MVEILILFQLTKMVKVDYQRSKIRQEYLIYLWLGMSLIFMSEVIKIYLLTLMLTRKILYNFFKLIFFSFIEIWLAYVIV